MRSLPIILDLALAIVLWVTILGMSRQRRARTAADRAPAPLRSRRLHDVAAILATVGVTWLLAWFVTDATGPRWLHTACVGSAVGFIAVAAAVAGYAGWLGAP